MPVAAKECPGNGAVAAVGAAFRKLDFICLIGSRPSMERDLVCAMVAARIIRPHIKLATTRWWHTSTLAEEFGVTDAGIDEFYAAMDWLLRLRNRIQGELAKRRFREGGLVLHDLTTTWIQKLILARIIARRAGAVGW